MKLCPQCNSGYHDSHTTCPTHGGVLNEIRDLRPGMLIHKTYRIVRKLGRGGMGTVYLADHVFMHEQRALKFLAPELCEDAEFTERFRREVWTLKQIRHRNVIHCGDLEPAEDDSLFFAMEYVDGPDLREFLKHASKPMDLKTALEIARGIAEGLGAAHALGMVHRDIKPENILMARPENEWRPKIADFGIVATRESTGHRTRTGGTLLTMQYAAPEQWRGMRSTELDGRTDLYALGCVMYEMLTGRAPFEAESYEEWAEKHKNALPAAPSQLRPELANLPGLDLLLWRMLAKDRDRRPADAAEVMAAIDAITSGGPAVATPRYRTVVEPPQFPAFGIESAVTQPAQRSPGPIENPGPAIAADPGRSDSAAQSGPPAFVRPVENAGIAQIWDRTQDFGPPAGLPPPLPDWLLKNQPHVRQQRGLAAYLLGNLGFSGRLIFAGFLGLDMALQAIRAIRMGNVQNLAISLPVAAGCLVCGIALALQWKRGQPVKWLGMSGWFAIALVEAIGSLGGLVTWISRYGAAAAFLRFGSGWLSTLCVASAAVYFGLAEIAEQRARAGRSRGLVSISRLCFTVLLLLLGVLDVLKILPYSGSMAHGPRIIMCLLGAVESGLAVMLLAKFRVRFAAAALAAAYVVMIPIDMLGNLQGLRMVPLLVVTLPAFMLALAGCVLALADDAPIGASLDTSPHAP
jgi:serine/threonine-protein kinase